MHDGFEEFEFVFDDFFKDFIEFINKTERENDDGNCYLSDPREFEELTKSIPVEEVGLSFSGEVELDDGISVITDKQVKMNSPEDAVKTYHKVMEVRELTALEQEAANKWRLFFKKLFEVFFRNSKFRVYYVAFCSALIGIDVALDNYFGAFLMMTCILVNTSSIKFAKELKKMIGSKKRLEELNEELEGKSVLGYSDVVPDDRGIQLYFKPKESKMF